MEIKDKPSSMSVREWIAKKIAQDIMIPEKVIRLVEVHQFDSAYEALNSNKSIEISGFGKFFYNDKKAATEKERLFKQKETFEKQLDSGTATEKERLKAERDLKVIKKNIISITNKGI